ncbi:hypothetical protein ABPG72_012217 [Tetrahymena utriculariae]
MNNLQISSWDYLKSLLFCYFSKFYNNRKKIIDYSIQKLYLYIDIFNIINKLNEIEKLKRLILDEDQLNLFNYLPKPTISADILSKYDFQQKRQEVDLIYQDTRPELQKASESFQAYENILSKQDLTTLDQKLINQIDPSLKAIFQDTAIQFKLQKLVELDNKQMFSKIYKHVKKLLIYIQNEDSRILLTQAFLYNFGNCEIFSPKFARVCINGENSYQRLWITDSEVEKIFSSCIVKRQISPLIKDIVISQNKQQAYKTAQALTKSGNFIHFYNQIIYYQHNDNDQQNLYNYTQAYFQVVKQFEQKNLSFTTFYKHIMHYLITNPQLVLYDLYD